MRQNIIICRSVQLVATVLILCLLVSCVTSYYPKYTMSPGQDGPKFSIKEKDGRYYAFSGGSESIVIMTFPVEGESRNPSATLLPFFIKVVNFGKNKITFDPKMDLSIYLAEGDLFVADSAHKLALWDRNEVVEYYAHEAKVARTMAILGVVSTVLAGAQSALQPGSALAQTQSRLAANNQELGNALAESQWDKYEDFKMNNDILGACVIPPNHQTSGQLWAGKTTGRKNNIDIFNYSRAGSKRLLMILHVGNDYHKIYAQVESLNIYRHMSAAGGILLALGITGASVGLGLALRSSRDK